MTVVLGLMLRHWRLLLLTLWIAGLGLTIATQQRLMSAQASGIAAARQGLRSCRDDAAALSARLAVETRLSAETRRDEARSAASAARACDARVAEARRRAGAITALVRRPPELDRSGCPVRELMQDEDLDAVFPRR